MSDRKLMLEDPAAYYMQLGREQERERIIKLLVDTDLLKTIESGALVNYADTAIELIKGEQK